MTFKGQYEKSKVRLLNDKTINKQNREEIFEVFFTKREKKLKRRNQLQELDEPCYKTLLKYINKFRNVNIWFKNKPWKDLTKEEKEKVYDDLEDGVITNRFGKRFGDLSGYYSKIFKSLPFELAGDKDWKEVLEASSDKRKKEVEFVSEDGFKKIVSVVSNPHHLSLLWLSWDIGENINTFCVASSSTTKTES